MLKIINVNPIVNNTVEIDHHVPFTVNVDEKNVCNEKKSIGGRVILIIHY